MLDGLKGLIPVSKKKSSEVVEYKHKILYVETDDGWLHILKCPLIKDNQIKMITSKDRHFFFCPNCGKRLDMEKEFVDAQEEKARREKEKIAPYSIG